MKKMVLTTAAVLGVSASVAFAASPPQYNVVGNPFPMRTSMADVLSTPPAIDVGSQSYQNSGPGHTVAPVEGQVLPINGGNGIVQTANSLPPGFEQGTPNFDQAQSVHRYMVEDTGAGQRSSRARNRIVEGTVLPPNGSNGIVQTANSLPPGFAS